VKVEVRATGLKALREKRGLTQRRLAQYFGCSFEDLFETVPVNPEAGEERRLVARS
jgi:transcriptional regulator with XRE-family HTH domain